MFRRCVLIIEDEQKIQAALQETFRLVPQIEELTIISQLSLSFFHWMRRDPWATMEDWLEQGETRKRTIEHALSSLNVQLDTHVLVEVTTDSVIQIVREANADLLITSPLSYTTAPHLLSWLETVIEATHIPLVTLNFESTRALPRAESSKHWLCVLQKPLENNPLLLQFLRAQTTDDLRVTFLTFQPYIRAYTTEEIHSLARLLGVHAQVDVHNREVSLLDRLETVDTLVQSFESDLIIVSLTDVTNSIWRLPLLSHHALKSVRVPVAFLPSQAIPQTENQERSLSTPDIVWKASGTLSLYVEEESLLKLGGKVYSGDLFVSIGTSDPQEVRIQEGYGQLEYTGSKTDQMHIIGLHIEYPEPGSEGTQFDTTLRIVHPGDRCVVLFDTRISADAMRALHTSIQSSNGLLLGVRMQRRSSLKEERKRLHQQGLQWLVDAGQILEDGHPSDLPSSTESLRLLRTALRLRSQGIRVIGCIVQKVQHIDSQDIVFIEESDVLNQNLEEILHTASHVNAWPTAIPTLKEQLDTLTQAPLIEGNHIQPIFSNRLARKHLLDLFEHAQERIHIQVYIIHDDEVTQTFERTLYRAANKGIQIRLLVDSLYSLHGSFGFQNKWLQRVSRCKNIEVRVFRPIDRFPDLEALKQRDHRKFCIVDGTKSVVTGRNFALSYYKDFDEVIVTPRTPEQELPWLDAGIRIQGPIVDSIEQSFLNSWVQAGGNTFEVYSNPTFEQNVACRFVQHEGLRDTYTLDAQLALIRNAQSQLTIVNAFPLQREVLHALIQAVRRGVHVQILMGYVRPLYGENQAFPGNPMRLLATQVILSRIDQLVAAGGKAFAYAMEPLLHWDADLKRVHPYVHAKMMTCDGRYTALGSANFDITGGFWESEALLLLEDVEQTKQIDAQIEHWLKSSKPLTTFDPNWQRDANVREWLDRVWPSIIA